MASTLKDKTISGIMWTSIQKFAGMGISFISGIILARLLTPYDYGCIGMLSIFMVIATSVVDGGFGSALIQKRHPTQEDYSTVFFFNLGMSLLMYVSLYLSAPAISHFYKMPQLCSVLQVQGLVLIINAFSLIQSNQLRKQFKFQKISIVTLLTSVISIAVAIYLAYNGYGVWALVISNLLSALIPALVYWITNKWYPTFVFSKKSFKELFGFGIFMFLTQIINSTCNNIQGLLIGKFYNPATMGYYSKAKSTEELASKSISDIMGMVTYPLYAEYQNDTKSLSHVIKRLTAAISYLTFPMMALLILLAKPIFVLLYSDRWTGSVPYFQILCLAGIAICLQGINYQAVAAVGKSKQMFTWTLIKRAIGLIFVVGGLAAYGINGLLVGMVLSSWAIYFINAYLVHVYVGYKITGQLLDILPILILSVVVFVAAYCMVLVLPDWNMYAIAVLRTIIYVVLYMGTSILFKMKSYGYMKETLLILLTKRKE